MKPKWKRTTFLMLLLAAATTGLFASDGKAIDSGATVITSYSIHYTKLYEIFNNEKDWTNINNFSALECCNSDSPAG